MSNRQFYHLTLIAVSIPICFLLTPRGFHPLLRLLLAVALSLLPYFGGAYAAKLTAPKNK